jgi:uncharacterized membrane protein
MKHPHEGSLTFGQRLADGVANFMGSWPFIIIQTLLILCWIVLNLVAWAGHWDPYPFILLNLLFSTQAAYAAPIIMMSQNRSAERDRAQALADYETNQKAEVEIEELQVSLARIENEKLDRILAKLDQR